MTKKRFWLIFATIILTLLAGAAQSGHLFAVAGIRPNLVLIFLVVAAFFVENLFLYCLFILAATTAIRFGPGISTEALALALVALLAFAVKQRAIWPGLWGSCILIFFGTFGLYLIVAPQFIYQHLSIVLMEIGYNLVLGTILFEAINFYARRSRITI